MVLALLILVFWLAGLALAHVYFLYPAVLYLIATIRAQDVPTYPGEELPTVSLVIAAYNEEEVIAEKIRNSLRLDYPDEKLEIIVFSDASSDWTDEIVRSFTDQGVRLERIEGRVGKTECQNRVTEMVDSDIVVYSDADSMYEADAIKRLIERFGPDVGGVVGELRYKHYGVEAESAYRTFEKFVKRLEPRVTSIVGGNGAIYAVRTSSYVRLPPDQISDFAEPLALVASGERVEYAPEAIAWENTGETVGSEVSRRIRIVTRSWNTLVEYSELLNPVRRPLFSFQLISHTMLRWFSPFLLLIVGITNVVLVVRKRGLLYSLLLVGQVAFYVLAALGRAFEPAGRSTPKSLYVPYYFLTLNYSLLVGFWNFVRKQNIVTWETESRDVDAEAD